jgi:hypothetical protein
VKKFFISDATRRQPGSTSKGGLQHQSAPIRKRLTKGLNDDLKR